MSADAYEFSRVLSCPVASKKEPGFQLTAAAVLGERIIAACDDGSLRIFDAEGVGEDAGRELRLIEVLSRAFAGGGGGAVAKGAQPPAARSMQAVPEWGVLLSLVGKKRGDWAQLHAAESGICAGGW